MEALLTVTLRSPQRTDERSGTGLAPQPGRPVPFRSHVTAESFIIQRGMLPPFQKGAFQRTLASASLIISSKSPVLPFMVVDNSAITPIRLTVPSDASYDQAALSFSHHKRRGLYDLSYLLVRARSLPSPLLLRLVVGQRPRLCVPGVK